MPSLYFWFFCHQKDHCFLKHDRNNVLGDYNIWMSDMMERSVPSNRREELEIFCYKVHTCTTHEATECYLKGDLGESIHCKL